MRRFAALLTMLAMMLNISFAASDLSLSDSTAPARTGALYYTDCHLFPGQDELPVLSIDDDDRAMFLHIESQKQLFNLEENKPEMALLTDQLRNGSRGSPVHIKDLIILKLRI